ncbi:hypothetical protein AB0K60_17215 [Thermopolyspora sp. NPDC052614]|uniref:hypothetical protein n=1 Tax=Thermopolyspora sp. NPDC052614 TaxID=3155682 RepID=UPI00341F997C
MPRKPRSLKQEMDRLTAELREAGWTWTQVAAEYRRRYRLNPRQAFREAHRLTQAAVTLRWDALWPDDPLSVRKLGWWEAWPGPTGHEPPLAALNRLARIYQCRTTDLIDAEDHTPADPDTPHPPDTRIAPSGDVPATEVLPSLAVEDVLNILSRWHPEPFSSPARTQEPRDQEYDRLIHSLVRWAAQVKRRDALTVLGAAATAAYASPAFDLLSPEDLDRVASAVADPVRVDDATVDHMETVLRHVMRQEDALGPQPVLETMIAQHRLLQTVLAGGASDQVRPKLLSLLANAGRSIAWMLFNLNDFNSAHHYYAQAHKMAHLAADDATCSLVLAAWSHLTTWHGDPRLALEHALGAQRWSSRTNDPLLSAYAYGVEARAHAAIARRSGRSASRKDRLDCMRALERSKRELSRADPGDGSSRVYFYSEATYMGAQARCLLDMGTPTPALHLATTSLATLDPALIRDVAYTHLYAARAHMQLRNIEQACEHISEAAALARRNTSPRLARSIVEDREKLNPWNNTHAVSDLDDRIRSLG